MGYPVPLLRAVCLRKCCLGRVVTLQVTLDGQIPGIPVTAGVRDDPERYARNVRYASSAFSYLAGVRLIGFACYASVLRVGRVALVLRLYYGAVLRRECRS
jgi:hypothetical protein